MCDGVGCVSAIANLFLRKFRTVPHIPLLCKLSNVMENFEFIEKYSTLYAINVTGDYKIIIEYLMNSYPDYFYDVELVINPLIKKRHILLDDIPSVIAIYYQLYEYIYLIHEEYNKILEVEHDNQVDEVYCPLLHNNKSGLPEICATILKLLFSICSIEYDTTHADALFDYDVVMLMLFLDKIINSCINLLKFSILRH
jgi:hypothetical protein